MPTKSISTIKAGQVLDATHFLKIADAPVSVLDIEGETNSTTGTTYYIQLLHTDSPTSGVTKPMYSRMCVPAAAATGINGFSFVYRPLGLNTAMMTFPDSAIKGGANSNPVYVAISTTDAVYTSVAASTHVTVDIEDATVPIADLAIVGDETTGVSELEVFADPGASHRLVKAQVTNSTGAVGYLMLFGHADFDGGDLPLQQWTMEDNATIVLDFGAGVIVQQTTTDQEKHTGCYLVGSDATQTLSQTGANWTMKAWYK